MAECPTCGGFDYKHDEIAHGLAQSEEPWDCICGSGDDGEWHTAACAIHNTPDEIWES